MSEFLKRHAVLQDEAGGDGSQGGSGTMLDLSNPEIKAQVDALINAEVGGLKAKNAELLGKLQTSNEDLKNFKGQFDGLDIGAVKGLLEKVGKDEETKLLAEGKVDEVFAKRTERLVADWEARFNAEKKRADDANGYANKFKQSVVKGQIVQEFIKAKGLPEASDDIAQLALSNFTIDDNGNAVAIDSNGNIEYGKDGKNPLSVAEWVETMREKKSYLFQRPNGTGSQGGNNSTDSKTVKRSDFDAMTPEQRQKHIRSGGKIID